MLAATKTANYLLGNAGTLVLLRMLQVGTQRQLPRFWQRVAQAKGKAQQVMELNNTLSTNVIM